VKLTTSQVVDLDLAFRRGEVEETKTDIFQRFSIFCIENAT